MRLSPWVITHTEQVLREVLQFSGPADVVISRYFREHAKLGMRERGAIAETVEKTLNRIQTAPVRSIEDVYAADALARKTAEQFLAK